MTDRLSHRGPDVQNTLVLPDISLGHSRLKIIDTSDASNQPYTDGRYYLIYNGELYNYQDLKKKLCDKGVSFKTEGDTEVLFHWLRMYGEQRLADLDGMFAFVFWDSKNNLAIAARDPLGIKPLYYTQQDSKILISSEIQAFDGTTKDTTVSEAGLNEYLRFQSVKSPNTLVDGIHKIEPGQFISFSANQGIKKAQFEDYTSAPKLNNSTSKSDFTEQLKKHLYDAVEKRLISDVSLGAFLSGGVDSSVVVAMMRKAASKEIRTFTLGFENSGLDERSFARQIAQHLDTTHTEVVLTEDQIIQKIPEAVEAMDVPSGDAINTYLVAEAAKESGLTVSLSGLGGDELVGGYPSFKSWKRARFLHRLPFNQFIVSLLPGLDDRQKEKLTFFFRNECNPENWVHSLRSVYLPGWLPNSDTININSDYRKQGSDGQRLSWAELDRYTIPLLLSDSDQMGMAHALEIRVPLLDRSLVQWMIGQSDSYRFPQKGHPKQILIDAVSDMIPAKLLERPKQGFVLPMDQWIRKPLKDYTASGLFDTPLPNFIAIDFLESIWNKFLDKSDHRYTWSRIWTLSVLGHWMANKQKG